MKKFNLKSVSLLSRYELNTITGGNDCWDYYVTVNTRWFESEAVANAYANAWNHLGKPCSVDQLICYST